MDGDADEDDKGRNGNMKEESAVEGNHEWRRADVRWTEIIFQDHRKLR